MFAHELPEVFSARDIARAAGVAENDVRALIHAGEIRTIGALLPGFDGCQLARLHSAG